MQRVENELNVEAPVSVPIKIAIIDDEAPMRRALTRLLKSAGIETITFSSACEFLDDPIHRHVDCAVTDMRMPGFDGLELQEELKRTLPHLSLVFITGHGDIQGSVRAMKGGAVDFLEKPVDGDALLSAIRRAAERSRALKASHEERMALERRYAEVTPREREVFALVTSGLLNKQIAADLGVTERTIKVHRARVMEKMGAESLADLVRKAERLAAWSADSLKTASAAR
jgi:FixJ family two-component response regulator